MTDRPDDRATVLDRLRAGDRTSFLPLVADLLECAPSPEALQSFAEKAPDRYWQAVILAMKAAGFSERVDLHVEGLHAIVAQLNDLPDSELAHRLSTHTNAFLNALSPPTKTVIPIDKATKENAA